jgi:hypothetical protein
MDFAKDPAATLTPHTSRPLHPTAWPPFSTGALAGGVRGGGIAGSLNEARWFYAPTGRKGIAQGKAKRRPGIRAHETTQALKGRNRRRVKKTRGQSPVFLSADRTQAIGESWEASSHTQAPDAILIQQENLQAVLDLADSISGNARRICELLGDGNTPKAAIGFGSTVRVIRYSR